ncbi:MAG: lactate utilization protein [Christensenellales bacterium]|jgi:hypothetical protein
MDYLKTKTILEKNGFSVALHATLEAAASAVLAEIPLSASVGFGGSVTVDESGLYDQLRQRGNRVYWHWKEPGSAREATLAAAHNADIYLSSTNALTMDGVLINIDGTGNRVAALAYGPKAVHLLVGKNKLAEDIEAGYRRVKEVACPLNARRLGLKTPCTVDNKCHRCANSITICRVISYMDKAVPGRPFTIHIIDQEVGY